MKLKFLLALVLLAVAPLSQAAISVVQSKNTSTFAVSSASITLTSTPTVGNYVIVGMSLRGWQSSESISSVLDNQTGNSFSNVLTQTGPSGTEAVAIYIAKVNSASGTYTVTVTSSSTNNYALWAMEVSGISGAVDKATGFNTSLGGATTVQSVTQSGANTNANAFVLAVMGGGNYSSGVSMGTSDPPSSGYTTLGVFLGTEAYGGAADAGYKIVSSIETDAASWTTTTSTMYGAVIASFPAASGGGGGGGGNTGSLTYMPGTFISQWATLTSNTTLSYLEPEVLCDAHLGAFTITLPTAVNSFTTYHVKKIDSSANTCTVATTNSQTIDGATTKVLSSQYSSVNVVSDNANWWAQ